MAIKFLVSVNWPTTDKDEWQTFEPDGILSVWNSRAHQVDKLTIQNEAEAITLLREVKHHKRMSLWVSATNSHVVHEFIGVMQLNSVLGVSIEVYRVVAGGSAEGVQVFEEDFLARVISVLAGVQETFVVNFRVVGGVAEEYFDDE